VAHDKHIFVAALSQQLHYLLSEKLSPPVTHICFSFNVSIVFQSYLVTSLDRIIHYYRRLRAVFAADERGDYCG
jgi:hypothetical protein